MSLQDYATAVVLGVAALSAIGVIVKWLRGGFKAAEDLSEIRAIAPDIKLLVEMSAEVRKIVARELNHNHGSSMKDDTYGTAMSVRYAHQRIDEIYNVLGTFAEANHLVLPIIADAINAQPPNERTQV